MVATGFHGDTEGEWKELLWETITEIGMAKLECPAKPVAHAFIYSKDNDERNKLCQISKDVEERIEREEDKDIAIDG